ncbi:MAG: hypothetical protein ACOYNF_17815, partial [Rhodoferax sp.]
QCSQVMPVTVKICFMSFPLKIRTPDENAYCQPCSLASIYTVSFFGMGIRPRKMVRPSMFSGASLPFFNRAPGGLMPLNFRLVRLDFACQ